MEIKYQILPAVDISTHRCQVLLANKLQCSERAAYRLFDKSAADAKETPVDICKGHLQVEINIGTDIGDTYILVDSEGNKTSDLIATSSVLQPQLTKPTETK